MKLHLYQYAELLSLLLAIICCGGLRHYRISLFIPLLVIVNLIEIMGTNYRLLGWPPWLPNYSIYNFNLLLETPLRLVLMGKMLQLKSNERHTFTGIIFFCMLAILLNYLFLQGPVIFNTLSLMLIQTVTIVLASFTLLRLALREDVSTQLWNDPYFWINAGYLLFSLVTLLLLGLQPYLIAQKVTLWGTSLYKAIMPLPNIILYSCYAYSFILCQTTKAR